MKKIVEQVADGEVKKVTIAFEGVNAKIAKNVKEEISVERTEVRRKKLTE